jgi:proton-dependent oligopeptide transporter, POT family
VGGPRLFGHPTGLFTLFFAEMWERFSYYGMRALLVFYMTKGFLGYSDKMAYGVYGAYTALVYATPFIGGMLADRVLGARLCVILGGILMSLGHLTMTMESPLAFYTALALLILGNGFFKPNISTIVGSLYPPGSTQRDAGFTLFYMGINLGAAMSPLLCGYIGETYGWHYGFGLATIGMMVGLATFVMPNIITQLLIAVAAVAAALALFVFHPSDLVATLLNYFIALALLAAAGVACVALSRGGLSGSAGRRAEGDPSLTTVLKVVGGIVVALPVAALLVSGFSIVRGGEQLRLISEETIKGISEGGGFLGGLLGMLLGEVSKPAGLVLTLTGVVALTYLFSHMARMTTVPRQRMYVVLILTFFSMIFWAFFEQAGSSVNNFTDRNVDRVSEVSRVTPDQVGQTLRIQPTQEQLGYRLGEQVFTLDQLSALRKANEANPNFEVDWPVAEDNVGMGIATRDRELPASVYQAVNPTFILLFGLVFTALWSYLGARGLEPNTAIKFSLGLLQLGLGFGAFWIGAALSDERGMVSVSWLLLGYLLHTTGELCLSPVGLSMIVKLTPKLLVSTAMGTWFLATAFSQYLAGIIAMFTGAEHEEGAVAGGIPAPADSVHVYGDVFGSLAVAAVVSGLICLAISPVLNRWMHSEVVEEQ